MVIIMELNTLNRTLLFDSYGEMLTEKQRLCFDYRFNQDLSLAEIGELEGISRQAVHDNIVRSEVQLLEMEEKIGAVKRQLRQDAAVEALTKALNECCEKQPAIAEIQSNIQLALEALKE